MSKKLKLIAIAISLVGFSPVMVSAAEIFSPDEQLQHGKEMVDSQNIKEKRKLELEIAILNNEIKNIDGSNQKTIEDAVNKARADIEKQYKIEIMSLKRQVSELEVKNKRLEGQFGSSGDQRAEDIFYTGMIQIGSLKKAEVIANGSRSMLSVGESIAPGLTISSIHPEKLVVKTSAGMRTFGIKSTAQIAEKLYDAAIERAQSDRSRNTTGAIKLPDDFNLQDLRVRD